MQRRRLMQETSAQGYGTGSRVEWLYAVVMSVTVDVALAIPVRRGCLGGSHSHVNAGDVYLDHGVTIGDIAHWRRSWR